MFCLNVLSQIILNSEEINIVKPQINIIFPLQKCSKSFYWEYVQNISMPRLVSSSCFAALFFSFFLLLLFLLKSLFSLTPKTQHSHFPSQTAHSISCVWTLLWNTVSLCGGLNTLEMGQRRWVLACMNVSTLYLF